MSGQDFKPGSEEHLAEVLAHAIAAEQPLELIGRGSKRGFGRAMQTAGLLDLSGFSGIRMYEPDELVMSAGPATPLAEIEAALAAENQELAFEPPHMGHLQANAVTDGSIGGVFACNLAGPRRFRAGSARDHLLGFRGVSGRGEIFKSGGRVVKNVTGYDLCKLMCGSFGTLAAMTEVTFKVLPRAEKIWTVLAFGLSAEQAVQAMADAAGSPHDVSGLCHLPTEVAARSAVDFISGAGASVTAIRLEGPAPSVTHRATALKTMLAAVEGARPQGIEELHTHRSITFWREVRDVSPLLDGETVAGNPLWRLSVTPTDGARTMTGILDQVPGRGLMDWAGGQLWLALEPGAEDGGVDCIRSTMDGGHATLIRGAADLRARIPVFQPQPAPLAALTKRIKDGFDPRGVLNPGRMVEGV
ncbi:MULTISPECIES: glycolate oxidase subunit GlcE [unclassified Minwuia]|jgi:glycolate dehydrogenase FAD-binding subunit|uniref:glycolate oxidase subunit GlcE n=1 Tax=unclassified Minwuia TaxID=2618799 RepID=UPI00247B27FA|nr:MULTISPECIES: glycolate oxidase subunit GlcE [unclassified Minwuia]